MRYDEKQLDDLFLRATKILGSENLRSLASKPRGSAIDSAILQRIKAMDNDPSKVTDEQILGAFEIALTVWSLEAEISANVFSQPSD